MYLYFTLRHLIYSSNIHVTAVFTQIMDTMLSDFEPALLYLDDTLIKSKFRREFVEHIGIVFKKISLWIHFEARKILILSTPNQVLRKNI